MFAIKLRVRPCSARCSPRSVGRRTTIVPSSCATSMSRSTRSSSSPRTPLTRTASGSMKTSTPVGTGMGCFPMRLIVESPDVGDDLAADAFAVGLVAGHDSAGSGNDRRAHAAQDLGDLARVDVRAAAGRGDALDAGDDRRALLDVPPLAQDARQLHLELARRDDHRVVLGAERVPDAREEIGYWIVDCHRSLENYQLDFVRPGMYPSCASSRRQIRQTPNLRKYARERPQRLQRL